MKLTLDGKTREIELANLHKANHGYELMADIVKPIPDTDDLVVIGSVEFDEDETDDIKELMR
jgi:hypothetical protein